MRWPWKAPRETDEAIEHRQELAGVTGRLDVVEERVDVLEDEIAVLQRNGDEA